MTNTPTGADNTQDPAEQFDPDPVDVAELTRLLDLLEPMESNEQRARYLLTCDWMIQRGAIASTAAWAGESIQRRIDAGRAQTPERLAAARRIEEARDRPRPDGRARFAEPEQTQTRTVRVRFAETGTAEL